NQMWCDADIEFVLAVAASPFPDLSEHLLVQRLREVFVERRLHAASAAACPGGAVNDVFLFGLVEISAGRDPCLNQIAAQRRIERRCVVRLLKQISHGSSQRSRSLTLSRI